MEGNAAGRTALGPIVVEEKGEKGGSQIAKDKGLAIIDKMGWKKKFIKIYELQLRIVEGVELHPR